MVGPARSESLKCVARARVQIEDRHIVGLGEL